MTVGSLFTGIGGLDLGLEWAGFGPVVWQVEQDPFCRGVLERHWPSADRSVEDVRHAGSIPRATPLVPVGLICGGFPCQDLSAAGLGAGLGGERSGLWREFERVVVELLPRAVVVENVASGARRWVCEVAGALEALGYRTICCPISAADVGAPHRRARVFVVAYRDGERREGIGGGGVLDGERAPRGDDSHGRGGQVANAAGARRAWGCRAGRDDGGRSRSPGGHRGAVEPRVGRTPHGVPAGLDWWPAGRGEEQRAWEVPRTLADAPLRARRLRALGNAAVPECAYVAGLVLRDALAGPRGVG